MAPLNKTFISMINSIMNQKTIRLIPAQTGNRITDMWECNVTFLSVDY